MMNRLSRCYLKSLLKLAGRPKAACFCLLGFAIGSFTIAIGALHALHHCPWIHDYPQLLWLGIFLWPAGMTYGVVLIVSAAVISDLLDVVDTDRIKDKLKETEPSGGEERS